MVVTQQYSEQRLHIFTRSRFIKRDANCIENVATQVDFISFSTRQNRAFIGHFYTQGIEPVFMAQHEAFLLQTSRQNIGQAVDAPSNAFQASRAVEHRIQARDVRQQNLRRANVGVGFLAADMLLASLHRHAQRSAACRIAGNADNATWHRTFEFVSCCKECSMWAAVAHWYTETLCGTKHDVGTLFARCSQQNQRHKVSGNTHDDFALFQFGNQSAVIMHFASSTDLLQQHTEHVLVIQHFRGVIDNHVKAKGFSTGAHHIQRLRMHVGGNKEAVGVFQFADALGHCHCFGSGGRFVQQRSRGDIKASKIQRHLLEIKQSFKTALGYFRLIRRVRGIPAWIFQHVT